MKITILLTESRFLRRRLNVDFLLMKVASPDVSDIYERYDRVLQPFSQWSLTERETGVLKACGVTKQLVNRGTVSSAQNSEFAPLLCRNHGTCSTLAMQVMPKVRNQRFKPCFSQKKKRHQSSGWRESTGIQKTRLNPHFLLGATHLKEGQKAILVDSSARKAILFQAASGPELVKGQLVPPRLAKTNGDLILASY